MRLRLAPLAVFAMLALGGCATAPSAPATTPSDTAPSSGASAGTGTEPIAAELVVRGAGVELYDSEGGMMGSFVWADEASDALEVLELAFGAAPEPGLQTGDGGHYADFETYAFEGGFEYFSAVNLGKPRDEYFLPSYVQVDTGELINGVSIRTLDGLHVGGDGADVTALTPALDYPHPLGTAFLLDPVDASIVADPENATDMVAVIVNVDGVIARIVAPYASRSFV